LSSPPGNKSNIYKFQHPGPACKSTSLENMLSIIRLDEKSGNLVIISS